MFILNFKVNGNKLGKIFLGILLVIILIVTFIVCYRILGNQFFKTNDNLKQNEVQELTVTNYTNVLKTVHDDIDTYVGQKIKFSGYVFRMLDFNQNQFVLARDMIISSDFQYVIVGFLCEYENAQDFANETWVELTGEITKGNYHGDMPIINVIEMKTVDKPNEEYVYPPDDTYIPTDGIL